MEPQRTILYGFSAAALLSLLFPFSSASSTGRPGQPFMTADINKVAGRSYDYIVVGGGASGCPLAATLSQRYSVLLIERGGSPYGNPLIEKESSLEFYNLQPEDDFTSVAERFVSEDGVPNARGRVLGGTTAVNGGFYSRAEEDFIKRAGWEEHLVKFSYLWVESKVVFQPYKLSPWQSVVKGGLLEAGVVPFNGFTLEHVEGTKIGGRIFDRNGKRHTAADLLMAGNCKRITVLLNATVQNVIFQRTASGKRPRASGVRFFNSFSTDLTLHEVYLNRQSRSGPFGEVILSAGFLGSPQILILSGIGPSGNLKELNISPTIYANEEVGKGMQDNPSLSFVLNIPQGLQKQPPAGAQVVGVADDFRLIIGSLVVPISSNTTITTILAKEARPSSRGELRLDSTDPRQVPLVKFNYLQEENDLEECVKMARLIERVAKTKSVEMFLGRKQSGIVDQGGLVDEKYKEFCRKNVATFGHDHGGCLVGTVVDQDYKVLGVEGLRVVDGSTFTDSPGTNPMATLMMLGRYQGIKILRETQGY